MPNFPAYDAGMTRPVAINNVATTDAETFALCLTQFSGEILASYQRKLVLSTMVSHRNIKKGRSYQFPLVGRAKAHYHTAGKHVDIDGIKSAQRIITVPGLMTASTFVDDFEELVKHFEDRQQRAKELGIALADLKELHTAMVLAKVSHATKVIDDDDQYDGRWITNDKLKLGSGGAANKAELAAAVCEAIYQANVLMDEASVPEDGRNCALRSAEYYSLLEGINGVAGYAVNREYGGSGSFAEGKLPSIGGVSLVKTNNIPKKNYAPDADNFKYYNGDFSKLVGMVFLPEAIGCVDVLDVSVEHDRKIEYQGELVVARHAYGLGGLRPECCVALELATLSN